MLSVDNLLVKAIDEQRLDKLIEAAIFSAQQPVSVAELNGKLLVSYQVQLSDIRAALARIKAHYQDRGVELVEVASGYRFQVNQQYIDDIEQFSEEKAPKYSRALLETLALIAYKQPITRSEIEDIRGVSVSSHIMKTLIERDWIKVLGQKEVPGRPSMYGTTATFLDYFSLKSLSQLPELVPISESAIVNSAKHDIMAAQTIETQPSESETK